MILLFLIGHLIRLFLGADERRDSMKLDLVMGIAVLLGAFADIFALGSILVPVMKEKG